MDTAFFISSVIGFGPALFVMFFSLRKYAYPHMEGSCFEDRKVFFTLAIGMVFGTVIFTLERLLYPYFMWEGGLDFVMFMLIFVLAFVFVEDLSKFVLLNFKGYRGKFDSVFYGIAFGAGYAATAMVGYIYISTSGDEVSLTAMDWTGLALLSIATTLIHTSVGALLGQATSQKLGLRGLPIAIIPHIIFNLLMFPWFYTDKIWYSLAFLIPVTVLIYQGIYFHTIPETLPDEITRGMRRKSRRTLPKGSGEK